jgi:hypothetical protein
MESHQAGMVGFAKSLVDMTHVDAIERGWDSKSALPRIEVLEFAAGVCLALKG